MEPFGITDYQCRCPHCEYLMTPFRDLDGHKAFGCCECGHVVDREDIFLQAALPRTASHAVEW